MNRILIFYILCFSLQSCGGQEISNPQSVLLETGRSSRVHLQAMNSYELKVGSSSPEYKKILHQLLWQPGYTIEVRKEALHRLWTFDRHQTIRTLRQQLPRLNNWEWLIEVCSWISENRVVELNEGLISSWASPAPRILSEDERPEYLALVSMHGKEEVINLVFETLKDANKSWQQGYRSRCWDLLHRIGKRDRLIALLKESQISRDDYYLQDLRRAYLELGIVPHGREEILWIQKIATEEYAEFWEEAVSALSQMGDLRRSSLELRDIPVAVSVLRHSPADLTISKDKALNDIQTALEDAKHYYETEGGGIYNPNYELLKTHKDKLTWGDAMAIEMILRALQVFEVRSHLFDYALRDLSDESTEYGGVIALDQEGRFEILEFEPKIRHHNRRFNASQEMFDSAYSALFHFHFHAQKIRNGDHAGPGLGDKNYANSTRANCLVFTFISQNEMNVDFYRHGGVVVDLGLVTLD